MTLLIRVATFAASLGALIACAPASNDAQTPHGGDRAENPGLMTGFGQVGCCGSSGACDGDGIYESGETCDNGAAPGCNEGPSCAVAPGYSCVNPLPSFQDPSTCTLIVCGNGNVQPGEACDDGNTAAGDGCSATCQQESGWTCTGEPSVCTLNCGNGIPNAGEQCDDGNLYAADGCSPTCTTVCGDGFKFGSELCDDGNTTSGDGCSSTCATVCGDGFRVGTELCDDGNTTNGDGCSSTCTTTCGDSITRGSEQCDDGNANDGDACSNTCFLNCGDGSPDPGEECDDGILNDDAAADACRMDCQNPECGDAVQDTGEACDHGPFNTATEPGRCNLTCSAFNDYQYTPDIDHIMSRAPIGTVGLLMSLDLYVPDCLAGPPDYAAYDSVAGWLDGKDFIVGKKATLAQATTFNKVFLIYDDGIDNGMRYQSTSGSLTEPFLAQITLAAGTEIVIDPHGSSATPECPCGGPIQRFDWCSTAPPTPPPGPGPCESPTGKPCPGSEEHLDQFVDPPDVPLAPEDVGTLNFTCKRDCLIAGQTMLCPDPAPPGDLVDAPADVSEPCGVPSGTNQVARVCQYASQMSVNCPGYCEAPDERCWWLESKNNLDARTDNCGIRSSGGQIAIDESGECLSMSWST